MPPVVTGFPLGHGDVCLEPHLLPEALLIGGLVEVGKYLLGGGDGGAGLPDLPREAGESVDIINTIKITNLTRM